MAEFAEHRSPKVEFCKQCFLEGGMWGIRIRLTAPIEEFLLFGTKITSLFELVSLVYGALALHGMLGISGKNFPSGGVAIAMNEKCLAGKPLVHILRVFPAVYAGDIVWAQDLSVPWIFPNSAWSLRRTSKTRSA